MRWGALAHLRFNKEAEQAGSLHCPHACSHVNTHTHAYRCTCKGTHVCTQHKHIYTYICTNTLKHTFRHICTNTLTSTCTRKDACVYTCAQNTHTQIHDYIHIHTDTRHTYVREHADTWTHIHRSMHVNIYTQIHTHTHTLLHMYTHVCMYTYAHKLTQTHIHTLRAGTAPGWGVACGARNAVCLASSSPGG